MNGYELLIACLRERCRAALSSGTERGASTVETVIIVASLAALALAVMAAIVALVNGKLGTISL